MEMKSVSSSNVKQVGYEDGTMRVEFHNGGLYEYYNVPQSVYDSIFNTNSVGAYLRQNVYGIYESKKIS